MPKTIDLPGFIEPGCLYLASEAKGPEDGHLGMAATSSTRTSHDPGGYAVLRVW